MRALLAAMMAAVAVFGCGGGGGKAPPTATATATSEESQVRAKYAEYLDLKDEWGKLYSQRNQDRERAVNDAYIELAKLSDAGAGQAELEAAMAKIDAAKAEHRRHRDDPLAYPYPPHPKDSQIADLEKRVSAIRREYENRWKSLGLTVER
jgi:hypothetical protein